MLPAAAAAQSKPAHGTVPGIHAVRASGPITIDGRLDEELWLTVPPATAFTQREPDEGKPATEKTELRIVYDEKALYVGVKLLDSQPSRIARQLSRRDRDAEADVFAISLDPHHDHLTGAMFIVSAAGVQSDAILYNDSWQDNSWDAVWESGVKIDETGWTLEMRIPYSQLRFPRAEHHTFGINAMRYIQRKNERDYLVYVPKTESGVVSRFGHLEGLDGISPQRTVELLPYAVSRAEFVAPSQGDPFNDGSRLFGGAGIDLKYGLTSNLSLDGTINPDFGQVEVDPAVVNLTAFETFFEEKRPFFIEGANIFSNFGRSGSDSFWGFNRSEPLLFYSRRIGRSPQGTADGDFVDQPTSTTILGAAKLTGKTRRGWSIGLLEAVTGREHAQVFSHSLEEKVEVEPLTNYFVGRARRELGQRGSIGFLTTAVGRDLHTEALRDQLTSQAYVGGADGHYFLDAKHDWVLTGSLAGSYVKGSTAAIAGVQEAPQRYYQRPDAPHIQFDPSRTSLSGWTGSLNLNRNNGVHLVNAALWGVSPGFESGDAGFSFNSDRAGTHFVYQYRNPKVTRFARDRFFVIAKWYTWNFANEKQGDGLHFFTRVQFKNYWTLFGSAYLFQRAQDDRGTRGGPSMLSPSQRGAFIDVATDSRKRISVELNMEGGRDEYDGTRANVSLNIRYRPITSLDISAGPSYTRNHQLAQYVDTIVDPAATATYGARYIFATLDQKEFNLQTRVNYVLSPKLSFQLYMQPLVSVGAYSGYKQLAEPRTYDFIEFGRDAGLLAYDPLDRRFTVGPPSGSPFGFDNPDFNFKSLRLNAIFRWEWRPGSAMYFVWTEQREDDDRPGQFSFRRDLGRTFAAPANDVILFKIAYWFQR